MNVPFVDLKAQYTPIKGEVLEAIEQVLDGMHLNGGPNVEAFEKEFSAYSGAKHAIGVGSGTDALHALMLACDIGPGDEVITVAHTFVATTEAIVAVGAVPVFVDVDPVTHTMDPSLIEAAITPRTKAILPVHLYGQPADMDPINAIAKAQGLVVIEDACQAHGAIYNGCSAGTLGDAAAFSFYCGKNLGAYGEAGAVTTNNDNIAERVRLFRDHGSAVKYHHTAFGLNGRLDEIQAAVLRIKLRRLADWTAARRAHAAAYNSILDMGDIVTPVERQGTEGVYHLYVVETDRRDELQEWLRDAGVGTGVHYPVPVHLQAPYMHYGKGLGTLPVTEAKVGRILSLPMFAELTEEQLFAVAKAMVSFFAAKRPGVPAEAVVVRG